MIKKSIDHKISWSQDQLFTRSVDQRINRSQDLLITGSIDHRINWSQDWLITISIDPGNKWSSNPSQWTNTISDDWFDLIKFKLYYRDAGVDPAGYPWSLFSWAAQIRWRTQVHTELCNHNQIVSGEMTSWKTLTMHLGSGMKTIF